MDAQYFGVPQRRKRIALVVDYGGYNATDILLSGEPFVGDITDGRFGKVLPVSKGLRGNTSQSRTERKTTSADVEGCIGADDSKGENSKPYTLIICSGCEGGGKGALIQEDKSATLSTNNNQYLFQPAVVAYNGASITSKTNMSNPKIGDACHTLITDSRNYVVIKTGEVEGFDGYNHVLTGDKVNTLTCAASDSHHVPCVVMDRSAFNQGINANVKLGIDEKGIAFTHIAKGPQAVCYSIQGNIVDRPDTANCNGCGWKEDGCFTLNTVDRPAVAICKPTYIVRRLTPLECERLQGFPDGWTDIGEYTDDNGKKKKSSDASRYKALGNSIALPSWKYLIKRLCSCYERDATLASLFDGIGGFPHIWEQINGKGSCIWASEIEDFPIAVTKKRIG
jgi:DNA (cytosine-5)-methyltransferase 1